MSEIIKRLTVFKYAIRISDGLQMPGIPEGAQILFTAMQRGDICLWALVDIMAPPSTRVFRVVGTGRPLPHGKKLSHVGTVQDGTFVWHVFEVA